MKKVVTISLLFVFAGLVYAEINILERIRGEIKNASSSSEVTIQAQGAGLENCLSSLTVISNSTYTLRVLNGSTTDYSLLMGASAGISEEWPIDDMFCGDSNQTMKIKVDNGTYNINYQGKVVATQ